MPNGVDKEGHSHEVPLLSYTPAADWDAATADTPSEEASAAFAAYQEFEAELTENRRVRHQRGPRPPGGDHHGANDQRGVVATDGPFAELKEVLASFAVIDVASHERALEIVCRIVAYSASRSRSGRSRARTSRADR